MFSENIFQALFFQTYIFGISFNTQDPTCLSRSMMSSSLGKAKYPLNNRLCDVPGSEGHSNKPSHMPSSVLILFDDLMHTFYLLFFPA